MKLLEELNDGFLFNKLIATITGLGVFSIYLFMAYENQLLDISIIWIGSLVLVSGLMLRSFLRCMLALMLASAFGIFVILSVSPPTDHFHLFYLVYAIALIGSNVTKFKPTTSLETVGVNYLLIFLMVAFQEEYLVTLVPLLVYLLVIWLIKSKKVKSKISKFASYLVGVLNNLFYLSLLIVIVMNLESENSLIVSFDNPVSLISVIALSYYFILLTYQLFLVSILYLSLRSNISFKSADDFLEEHYSAINGENSSLKELVILSVILIIGFLILRLRLDSYENILVSGAAIISMSNFIIVSVEEYLDTK